MDVQPQFFDHEVVQKSPNDYEELSIAPHDLLRAWSLSMFAHELLAKNGNIKSESELSGQTLEKYVAALEMIKRSEPLSKPIIGIGIMDGVEIGIGREIIAACVSMNIGKISINVRKAQSKDVKKLLGI